MEFDNGILKSSDFLGYPVFIDFNDKKVLLCYENKKYDISLSGIADITRREIPGSKVELEISRIVNFFYKNKEFFVYKNDSDIWTIVMKDKEFPFSIYLDNTLVLTQDDGYHVKSDDILDIDGDFYTRQYVEESGEFFTCEDCGNWMRQVHTVNGEHGEREVCKDCRDENYTKCEDCGEWYRDADMHSRICDNCYCENYSTCYNCGELVHNDETCWDDDTEESYCNACYESRHNRSHSDHVHGHWCKLRPIFHGEGKLFFGIELEVDSESPIDDYKGTADSLHELSDNEKLFYLEEDGSLNYGIEIISRPYTLEFWQSKKSLWANMCKICVSAGLRSHDIDTTGLHIHASREGLGDNISEQNSTIAKLIYLYETLYTDMLKFSRRSSYGIERWSKRYMVDTIAKCQSVVRGNYSNGRYNCINLENSNTIEFRFFKGTLKIDTVMASIQFTSNMIGIARICDDTTIQAIKFADIIHFQEFEELTAYAKEKGLI